MTLHPITYSAPRVWYDAGELLVNHVGLVNPGIGSVLEWSKARPALDVPFIISIVVKESWADWREVWTKLITRPCITGVEINVQCPNAKEESIAWETIRTMRERARGQLGFGLKFPFGWSAETIRNHLSTFETPVDFVTLCNGIPRGRVVGGGGKSVLTSEEGTITGSAANRAVVLALLHSLRSYCTDHNIAMVACGGVSARRHVDEFLREGATAVQIGSQFMREGAHIFTRLLEV